MKLNTIFYNIFDLSNLINFMLFKKQIIDYNQEGAITSDNKVISLKKIKYLMIILKLSFVT